MKFRLGFVALGFLTACAGDIAESEDEGNVSAVMEPIIGGVSATATYPEAVLLNMKTAAGVGYSCSATVIAPTVVLTAGHCVDGMVSWEVYAGSNYRKSTKGETYDWAENGATTVNPLHHDIGLVYLTEAIVLSSYPVLAQTKQVDGTKALSVGRVLDGTVTNSLWDAPITLTDGAKSGYPYDYSSGVVIQHGDSGGPVFVSGTHNLVAVNSGAGSTSQVTARVDLLYSWIQSKVAAQPTTTTPPPTTTPSCTQETEQNNSFASANSAASTECGSLSGTDIDWFTYRAPVGTTTLALTPTADATMSVGFVSRGVCSIALKNTRSVRVSVSNAPATVCVSVNSAGRQTQTYRLTH